MYSCCFIFVKMVSQFVDPVTRNTLSDAIRAQNTCAGKSEMSRSETPLDDDSSCNSSWSTRSSTPESVSLSTSAQV